MNEGSPKHEPMPSEERPKKERMIALALELSQSQETFSFPGLDPDTYPKIKAAEEEYPGYTTPIDKLVERFKREGVKVVLGKHPESGNVFILPSQSNDIENDSISPKQLHTSELTDARLKELSQLDRS